jgi:hypothetical protein
MERAHCRDKADGLVFFSELRCEFVHRGCAFYEDSHRLFSEIAAGHGPEEDGKANGEQFQRQIIEYKRSEKTFHGDILYPAKNNFNVPC